MIVIIELYQYSIFGVLQLQGVRVTQTFGWVYHRLHSALKHDELPLR